MKTLNRRTIPAAVEKRESFKNSNETLRGIKNPDVWQARVGKLDDEEVIKYSAAIGKGITYLVLSYETPIAWETKDGEVYKVEQSFSVTTTKHMGLLYLFKKKDN